MKALVILSHLMTKDGILKFGALDTLPTAITGGLAYSASAFYAGL